MNRHICVERCEGITLRVLSEARTSGSVLSVCRRLRRLRAVRLEQQVLLLVTRGVIEREWLLLIIYKTEKSAVRKPPLSANAW